MQTFLEMQNGLKSALRASSSSTLYTTVRVKELINNGNQRATSLYLWPSLERARKSTVPAVFGGDQYMDYPSDFRTDTMGEFIYINGVKFSRIGWNEFLTHQLDDPNSDDKYFADYGRQIFLYPHQTVGVEAILWGQIQAPALVNDADETIFSKHDDTGNLAIIQFGLAEALATINPQASEKAEKSAVTMLSIIWDKIAKRQQYAQPRSKQMFNVPDFFGNSGFNLNTETD